MSNRASIDTRSSDTVQELAARHRRGVEAADPSALVALHDPDVLVDAGVWDPRLQALMAVQAPLVRP